ncbi:MAG: 30S ribosome-binding factor RbfA [Alphaproteobacteria bacterium]|nr:30S ribosome-binding factor RbfA [Alphaproteobacteria bacterium]
MPEKNRQGKVASEIKKILSEYLLRNSIIDEKGINSALISITDVTISPCLQHVKVYAVSLSKDFTDEDCVEYLQRHASQLRYHLGSHIRLKFTPELNFFVDNSFAYADKIESLFQKIHEEEKRA